MGTRLKSARVKTQDGWTTFTRTNDELDNVHVTESNLLLLHKGNEDSDVIAFFNPLGWSHIELDWEETDADS